jgi:hypothetical protein
MPTVLLTYGLNPATGLKLLINSSLQPSWSNWRQQIVPAVQSFLQQRPRVQVSLGALIPEQVSHLSKIELLTQLKFFISLETEGSGTPLPALQSGRQTGIQIYRHAQGETQYRAQIVRFNLGQKKKKRRRTYSQNSPISEGQTGLSRLDDPPKF